MSKLIRASVLFAAIAGLMVSASLPVAPAQVKDKDKKDDKTKTDTKKADPKAAEVGEIQVYTDKKGEWRYKVVVADKAIAIGTVGFEKKEDVMKVVEALKATAAKGKVVELKDDKK